MAKSIAKRRSNRREAPFVFTNPTAATSKKNVSDGLAKPHQELANNLAHVFVDDQNLFYGAVNQTNNLGFRVDFGLLLSTAAKNRAGSSRGVGSAYIAGVVPDDDSFWKIAEAEGFSVKRGFLGANNRSKQDDAHLITAIMRTLYEMPGPSTIVLVAGDADYSPPLSVAIEKGWRVEVCFHQKGLSSALHSVAHEIRTLDSGAYQLLKDATGRRLR